MAGPDLLGGIELVLLGAAAEDFEHGSIVAQLADNCLDDPCRRLTGAQVQCAMQHQVLDGDWSLTAPFRRRGQSNLHKSRGGQDGCAKYAMVGPSTEAKGSKVFFMA